MYQVAAYITYMFITALTMWKVEKYVYCLALVCLSSIYGQSIKPYQFCKDDKVSVASGSSGMLQFIEGVSTVPCNLELSGFDSTGHVSIPGIDLATTECQSNIPKLTINDNSYCVTLKDSTNLVFIPTTSGRLEITLDEATVGFSINYYSNGESFIFLLIFLLGS